MKTWADFSSGANKFAHAEFAILEFHFRDDSNISQRPTFCKVADGIFHKSVMNMQVTKNSQAIEWDNVIKVSKSTIALNLPIER